MKYRIFCNKVVLVTFFVILTITIVFAQLFNDSSLVTETVGSGEVNYSSGVVRASGLGAPPQDAVNQAQARAMAERAATTVARRNLLETVKGVRINSETLVDNFITQSDVIKTTVNGEIQNSKIIEKKYLPDGSVEVVVEMPLIGQISSSVLTGIGTQYKPLASTVIPSKDEAFTGLIINAQGLTIRPAMSPRIIDEANKEIYGSQYVNPDFAVSQGIIGYTRSIEEAAKNPRVAGNPLVIKALRVSGNMKADIVISAVDAERLEKLKNTLKFFSECRVMVIL